jgi:hypothetical protein
MKREEILNGNKLIAEFLNVKPNNYGDYEMYGVVEVIEDGENEQHFFRPQDMLFHSDWNWLMTVVDRCFNSEIDIEGNVIGEITHGLLDCNKETTFKAVVEFIEWYNENKYTK